MKSETSSLIASTWKYLTPLYIALRIWISNRMPIMDCDEVFNYWEPLHFLLYGTGFQTWEYANEYALRTYAYLMPLFGIAKSYQRVIPYLPAWLWPLLTTHQAVLVVTPTVTDTVGSVANEKIALFLLLRATLAAAMAVAEIVFCQAICNTPSSRETKYNVSPLVGLTTAILLLFSAGMSHAAGALLPSSSLTFLWLLSAAMYLREQHILFSFIAIVATLATGWPFGVLMFFPLGIIILWRERFGLVSFLTKVVFLTMLVQSLVMIVDKSQYGKWVSPTLNIFMYNANAGGDELYGIEPLQYYIKNLGLNFNHVAVAGVIALPLVVLLKKNCLTLLSLLIPMYLWLIVVLPRPHKEERFLFPIYPSLCFGAALLSTSIMDSLSLWIRKAPLGTSSLAIFIQIALFLPATMISGSRAIALSKYYTAPLQVYSQLHQHPDVADAVLCTCGEWYRFPSSFYLPSDIDFFGFVESSFQGQLPQPFLPNGSRSNNLQFNDRNLPVAASHTLIEECDYLVDLFDSNDCRENDSIWTPIGLGSFLDAEKTSSTFHRTLYIPYLHEQEESRGSVQYVDYMLYKRQDD